MNIRKGDLLKLKKELCTLAVSFPVSKLAALQFRLISTIISVSMSEFLLQYMRKAYFQGSRTQLLWFTIRSNRVDV